MFGKSSAGMVESSNRERPALTSSLLLPVASRDILSWGISRTISSSFRADAVVLPSVFTCAPIFVHRFISRSVAENSTVPSSAAFIRQLFKMGMVVFFSVALWILWRTWIRLAFSTWNFMVSLDSMFLLFLFFYVRKI